MKLMKPIVGIVLLAISIGCNSGPTLDALAYQTRTRLLQLSPGMTKREVITIMGSEAWTYQDRGTISKPYKSSMYDRGADRIEIFYYFTELQSRYSTSVWRSETTPLVFINGKLEAWGWESWTEKAKRYDININSKVN